MALVQRLLRSYAGVALGVGADGEKLDMAILGKQLYAKASASFWVSSGSTKGFAKLLAPRWYKVPANKAAGLTRGASTVVTSALNRCASRTAKQLKTVGPATVDGHAAVVLKDPGTAPGAQPKTIAIAATGAPRLLRIKITGPATPGPIGACNNPKTDKYTGTETFSHWNSVPLIHAPAHAVAFPTK